MDCYQQFRRGPIYQVFSILSPPFSAVSGAKYLNKRQGVGSHARAAPRDTPCGEGGYTAFGVMHARH